MYKSTAKNTQHGTAWHGMEQGDTAPHSTALHGRAGARHGRARPRAAPHGAAAGLALRCALLSGAELMMMRQAKLYDGTSGGMMTGTFV